MNSFTELGLSKQTILRLEQVGFKQPTDIQSQAIAIVLSGQDIMASAQTGSGKTAAYALPIIERLGLPNRRVRAVILVPTRELALQVKEQFALFSGPSALRTVVLYGGTGYGLQVKQLKRGADIVVATPGRLIDLLQRGDLDVSSVNTLVFDEADRLLDLGFMPQIRKVVACMPRDRQTLMFSATIDQRIERLAVEYLRNPARIKAAAKKIEPASIEQQFHRIHEFSKDARLLELVSGIESGSVLVFTRTKRKATWVTKRLQEANVRAEEIHGDISQNQRERTLDGYRKGHFAVLVATDVAARGLDIPAISHVVNYDLPQTAEDYVHRIGRTGRAGRAGIAHTFVCDDEKHLLRDIERLIGRQSGVEGELAPVAARLKALPGRRFRPRNRAARRF